MWALWRARATNGIEISEVNSFRYWGLHFSDDFKSTTHSGKRRQSAFAMLAKIEKLYESSSTRQYVQNIRPVIMYGIEIFELNHEELKKIVKLEALILKRMLGIKQRYYTRHIQLSLRIGLTKRYVEKMKLKFFLKMRNNAMTNGILGE